MEIKVFINTEKYVKSIVPRIEKLCAKYDIEPFNIIEKYKGVCAVYDVESHTVIVNLHGVVCLAMKNLPLVCSGIGMPKDFLIKTLTRVLVHEFLHDVMGIETETKKERDIEHNIIHETIQYLGLG